MFGKVWTVAMAAAIAGVLALPVPSAYAQGAKPMATKSKPVAMKKSVHKMSCYDYAWQSQQMKDCLAKASTMKKPMKKASTKKKKM